MLTRSYVYGATEEIRIGETYYFGQLWVGDGGDSEGEELLESGAIAVCPEETEDWEVVDFEIVEKNEDIMRTEVRIV